MAGELLIQILDERAYAELLPELRGLMSQQDPGLGREAMLRRALEAAAGATNRWKSERTILQRMLRCRDLRPTWFLSPRDLTAAINGLVFLLCFEKGGEYSLMKEIGPSWVVLDEAQRSLSKLRWFDQIFDGGQARGEALEFPIGDEQTCVRLSRADIETISRGLAALGPDSEACKAFPGTVAGLQRLIATATATSTLGLVCRTLL